MYRSVSSYDHDDVIKWKHFPRYWTLFGEFIGQRWIPRTKASDAELWCFFYLRLNKWFSKQSRGWWFETPPRPLWRHCNDERTLLVFSFFVFSHFHQNSVLIRFLCAFPYEVTLHQIIWVSDRNRLPLPTKLHEHKTMCTLYGTNYI